jgi:hypothetical protein
MLINGVAVNRVVHSAWAEGHKLHLIFTDSTELEITWGDTGPELCARRMLPNMPSVPITDGIISSQLAGKTISVVHVDEQDRLLLRCKCGHEAVIVYHDGPILYSMNVIVPLPPVSSIAALGRM